MSAIEQYLLDTYRASQHGTPMPPPPGRDDVAVIREVRDRARFHAVLAGRPAHHRLTRAVRRLFSRPRSC
ncbi:hypothetical protein ACFWBH_12110 [Streptomyces sp. NPDC059999]|uniref:hypothetical protein n=1 Tax=Streptomyces sp. NPDC059999 TaxID=3347030 RepID=UPI0036756017